MNDDRRRYTAEVSCLGCLAVIAVAAVVFVLVQTLPELVAWLEHSLKVGR